MFCDGRTQYTELHLHPFEMDTHLLPSHRAALPLLLCCPYHMAFLLIIYTSLWLYHSISVAAHAKSIPVALVEGTRDRLTHSRAGCLTRSFLGPLGPSCMTKDQGCRTRMGHPHPEGFEAGPASVPGACLPANNADGLRIWRGEQAQLCT